MASDQKNLEIVLERRKQEFNRNPVAEESKNLRNSLLIQYNWSELLQFAPTAINGIGACFVASASEKAGVRFTTPDRGFRYLRYDSLQANLIETANVGRYAFNEAQTGMGTIQNYAGTVDVKLKSALEMILDPEQARRALKPQFQAVVTATNSCAERSMSIARKFDEWLFYACEMHAACVNQERTDQDVLVSNEACAAAEAYRTVSQSDTAKLAKGAADVMATQIEVSSAAFKKASQECPSGWDIVAQQVVTELSGTVNAALKASISVMTMATSPLAGGADMVGGFLNKDKAPSDSNTTANQGLDDTNLKRPVDQAAIYLRKDIPHLELLNIIVNGPNGEIDWEKARPTSGNTKSSIAFVVNMLDVASSSFRRVSTGTETSRSVENIYSTALKVSREIEQVVKDSTNISATWPKAADPKVRGWKESFTKSYDQAQYINASVVVRQGSAGVDLVPGKDPEEGNGLDSKSLQGQFTLKAAQNRLDTIQKAVLATQENYIKASAGLLEQQNKVTELQGNLTRLATSNITMTEIKKILVGSIGLILQLKAQINNLVKFFNAFTSIVTTVVQLLVEPCLDIAKRVSSGQDDPNAAWSVGGYTLTDKMNADLFSAVVTLRAYFSAFADIARMWTRLSNEYIAPGLSMCDELSMMAQDRWGVTERSKKLGDWTKIANQNVRKIAEDLQNRFTEDTAQKAQEIADTTKRLTPAPAQKSIEAAKNDEVKSVATALDAKRAAAPIMRKSFQMTV